MQRKKIGIIKNKTEWAARKLYRKGPREQKRTPSIVMRANVEVPALKCTHICTHTPITNTLSSMKSFLKTDRSQAHCSAYRAHAAYGDW